MPTTKQFRQPYFMDIAPDGAVLYACDRFTALLTKYDVPDFIGSNFLDLFSRIGKIDQVGAIDSRTSAIPKMTDLFIQSTDARPFVIRWIPAPRYSMEITSGGWQLTGTKIYTNDSPIFTENHDILITTDLEDRVIHWNQAAERFYNTTAENAIGQPLAELTRAGYVGTSGEKVHAILLQAGFWEGETTYVSRDGKMSYLITAIRYIRDKNWHITGIMTRSRDIIDGFFVLDTHFNVKLWNHEAEKITCLSAAEVVGRSIWEMIPEWSDTKIGQSLYQAFKNKMTVTVEQYYERSGSWLEMSLYPSDQGMFAYFRDVTLRKQQDALLALEKKVLELNTAKRMSLQSLLNFFLKGIQKIFPGMYCMVQTLDQKTRCVRLLSAPGLPAVYAHAIDGLPIGPAAASFGTAMHRKETVIVSDIATDNLWAGHCDLALQFGLRACWSIPVVNERDEVLAAFSVYYTTAKAPSETETDTFERVANLVTLLIESRKAEEQLLQQEVNKQKLIAQAMVDAQEKERADIGKELHDNINQILSTTKLYLELAKTDNKERISLINRSAGNIHNAIREIRNISRSLVPSSIGDLGLIDSLTDLVEDIRLTRAIGVEFHHTGDFDNRLDDKTKLMLFRIIQEQINNVLRHSGARKLTIELILGEADNRIELSMTDDGKGFNPETQRTKGQGLSNIRSRADLFGGRMTIRSAPGHGCKLNVQIPVA